MNRVFVPKPNKSYRAMKLLGVELKPGQKPPKTFQKYENLLLTRLVKMWKDVRARAALMNQLENEGMFLERERPENDLEMATFLIETGEYLNNSERDRARLWYLGVREKNPEKDELATMTESVKLSELREASLLDWWNELKIW